MHSFELRDCQATLRGLHKVLSYSQLTLRGYRIQLSIRILMHMRAGRLQLDAVVESRPPGLEC